MPPLPPALLRNALSGALGWAGAYIWTKATARLAVSGLVPPRFARKLAHITTAPFFILTWPLYTPSPYARFIAAAVPLSFALRIARSPQNDPLAKATARGADKAAEGRGLAAYGLSVSLLTAVGWRDDAATYVAAAALACGDGAAEIVGSAVKGPVIPGAGRLGKRKTVAGSAAFVAATVLGGAGMLRGARMAGFAVREMAWMQLVKVATVAAIVELAPVEDNFTVPLVAFLASRQVLAQRWWSW